MTFRAKPVTRRKHRPQWENDERQQLVVTIGFAILILVALLILGGTVAAGYYNDHFAAVATVNGVNITKDEWNARQQVDLFRYTQSQNTIQNEVSAGILDSATAQSEITNLQQSAQNVAQTSLTELIDQTLQEQLAKQYGITVTSADIQAELQKEATTPEERKVLAIFVAPQTNPNASAPTAAQDAAAKAKADAALAALNAGTSFATVAKQYSTDPSASNGGDYGYLTQSNPIDKAWVDAVFQLKLNGTTGVIKGADGVYRIGRVTDIIPAQTDPNYQKTIEQSVPLSTYEQAVTGDLIYQKLNAMIVAKATTGNVSQVHAWEIYVQNDNTTPGTTGPEIRASEILFSPNGDPSKASSVPTTDPAWNAAYQKALATVKELRAITDPQQRAAKFAELAKTESNDTASASSGGDLGWFGQGQMVPQFSNALFNHTYQPYQILDPVQTQYGWHVIMYVGQRPDAQTRIDQIHQQLQQPNADWVSIAKAQSDGSDASSGGDMGWIARYQEPAQIENVLFALKPGQISSIQTQSNGFYVYRVTEVANRPVSADQLTNLKSNAFTNWYDAQKAKAKIWESPSVAAAASPTP